MELKALPGAPHLSYCSNIHAAESLEETAASLEGCVPAIRNQLEASQTLARGAPFGLGLRLSAQAAETLRDPGSLHAFAQRLADLQTYVFTVNAFPWGNFHQKPLKQAVYQPDWSSPRRLSYTLHCAQALAALLPEGLTGSISTVPLGFAAADSAAAALATLPQLRQAVVQLRNLHRRSGKEIVLALEPEPACLLENTADALHFFRQHWFARENLAHLAQLARCSPSEAQQLAQRHLGLCYDACHGAVEFEDPCAALLQLREAGIRIAKIQLSCALQVESMHPPAAQQLRAFDDGVYLHQVVRRNVQGLHRHADLPQALSLPPALCRQEAWRVHCHVPLFWRAPPEDSLASTWDSLRQVLRLLREQAISPHLEVETYTWDVLPPAMRAMPKAMAIARELHTVLQELQP